MYPTAVLILVSQHKSLANEISRMSTANPSGASANEQPQLRPSAPIVFQIKHSQQTLSICRLNVIASLLLPSSTSPMNPTPSFKPIALPQLPIKLICSNDHDSNACYNQHRNQATCALRQPSCISKHHLFTGLPIRTATGEGLARLL